MTLAGTNEQGAATAMKIFGVEILNEGSGISIDDAVSETQTTFVARVIEPWQAVLSRKKPARSWRFTDFDANQLIPGWLSRKCSE